jgi:hypothetical protein
MKLLLACVVSLFLVKESAAQFSRYIVQFRDKATTPFAIGTPTGFLSQRAIERRTRYAIPIDSTDLPVTPRYIDSLRLAGTLTILNVSRWLNQVSIQTTDAAAISKINSFPFVRSVSAIAARTGGSTGRKSAGKSKRPARQTSPFRTQNTTADFYSYGLSYRQVHIHNGEFLHNMGLRGQNQVIGILDGGFRSYTSLRAFDSVNAAGQVLGTYDFVAREVSVTEDSDHGMQCFSIIAGNIPGQFVGTAPKASFYLFRSEDGASEYPIEEHNWVCAAERLDSAGGDLISSSLGYSNFMSNPVFDHTYSQMDGNTTIAAKGADLAALKGILVVNAAGNDGNGSFRYISSPADGDSVMAVGAVTKNSVPANFSSYGPSFDGQVKPDVASVGVATVLQTQFNTIDSSNGTSYACPNIAGLAACLWQGFPEVNNIKILTTLRQAGHKATAPDDRVGYGIPDMKKAVMLLLKTLATSTVTAGSCRNTIAWSSKDVGSMRYEIERRTPGATAFTKIHEQAGTGTLFGAVRNYQFIDSVLNFAPGTITYRIRQVIDTSAGSFSADYIDTVTVNLAATCNVTSVNPVPSSDVDVQLMPNPTNGNFSIKIGTPYPVQQLIIHVTNVKGQTVMTSKQSKTSGAATFSYALPGLASGKYFVSLYNGEKLIVTKELLKL